MASGHVSSSFSLDLHQSLVGAGIGAIVFPVVLGFNQVAVFSPLRLSTRSPLVLASTLGGLSVSTAALAASYAVVSSYNLTGRILDKNDQTDIFVNNKPVVIATSSLISVVLYRALGGRFTSVLPSHLCAPGAFGHQWIPAGFKYANCTEKKIMQMFGMKHGCHSCGRRKGVTNFAADHQPPTTTVNYGKEIQRFYPHCDKCSSQQGGFLSGNSKSDALALVRHPFSLRLYHLFFPIPFGLALLEHYLQSETQDTNDMIIVKPEIDKEQCVVSNQETVSTTSDNDDSAKQSHLSNIISNFPVLIIWNNIMKFFDSLPPIAQFHLTLWTFSILAAFGR